MKFEALRLDNGEIVVGSIEKARGNYMIVNSEGSYKVAEASICGVGESSNISGNRWYRSRDQVKRLIDVVLVSKGHYDSEKHGSVLEALRVYLSGLCGCDVKYVTTDDVLRALVLPACELFLGKDALINILHEKVFKQLMVFKLWNVEDFDSNLLVDFITSEFVILDKDKCMLANVGNESIKDVV